MDDVTIPGARRFDIEHGGRPFRIFVYRPQAAAPAGGFPVIYTLDGNAHFLSMIASTKAHGVRPLLTGLDPAVVVGVGYPVDDDLDLDRRTFDYTPAVDRALLGTRPDEQPWQEVGGADAFLSFLDTSVKPRIEAEMPVDPRRQSLFGHSFGGLCTLYAALTRPASFRHFLVSSPSIWFGDKRVLAFLDGFGERLEAAGGPRSLVLSVGALEQDAPKALVEAWPAYADWIRRNNMIGNLRALHERLAGMSLPQLDLVFREIEDEHHGSVPPVAINKAMPIALRARKSEGRSPEGRSNETHS